MNMQHQEDKSYHLQGDRISQGSAPELDIVPVQPASLSCVGLDAVLPTGTALQLATVDELAGRSTNIEAPTEDPTEQSIVENIECVEGDDTTHIMRTDTSPRVSEDMECDNSQRATKRKLEQPTDTSQEDSEEDIMDGHKAKVRSVVLSERRPLEDEDDATRRLRSTRLRHCVSNPDLSQNKDEEAIAERKNETKRKIETGKKKIVQQKGKEKRKTTVRMTAIKKVGRHRKKIRKIDPLVAEKSILSQIETAPERMDTELLNNMTVSDTGAQALDYVKDIDIIRSKCGRIQGKLSGELKRHVTCIEDMIRSLQAKAESTGDPQSLRQQRDELLKEIQKYKKTEKSKEREISELKKTVKELKQENEAIRKEMKEFKESMAEKIKEIMAEKENSMEREDRRSYDNHSPEKLRPSLGGKPPTPIPENLQQKDRSEIVERQIELLTNRNKTCQTNAEEREKDQGKKEDKEVLSKRTKPWAKSNIQLKPPYSERNKEEKEKMTESRSKEIETESRSKDNSQTEEENREKNRDYPVVGEEWKQPKKGKKRGKKEPRNPETSKPPQGVSKDNTGSGKKDNKERIRNKKLPKTAAISIKGKTDKFSYAEALKKVRMKISLEELNIEALKMRKGISGCTIIEIKGTDNTEKADILAKKMQEVLIDEAYVSCPEIKGELRITGLDESVLDEDVICAVAKEGGCESHKIRTGVILRTRSGLGALWVRCPLQAAMNVAKIGKLKVGWTVAKVELLRNRPIQCFRCWRQGHVKNTCKSTDNFSNHCFQCGQEGHAIVRRNREGEVIARCSNKPWCIICARLKREANHRVGSDRCEGVNIQNKLPFSESRHHEVVERDTVNVNDVSDTVNVNATVSIAERRSAEEPMDI